MRTTVERSNGAVPAAAAAADRVRLTRLQRQGGTLDDFVVSQSVEALPRLDDNRRRVLVSECLRPQSRTEPDWKK